MDDRRADEPRREPSAPPLERRKRSESELIAAARMIIDDHTLRSHMIAVRVIPRVIYVLPPRFGSDGRKDISGL